MSCRARSDDDLYTLFPLDFLAMFLFLILLTTLECLFELGVVPVGAIEYDFLYKGTVATTGIDIQRLRKVELKKKVRDSVLKKANYGVLSL